MNGTLAHSNINTQRKGKQQLGNKHLFGCKRTSWFVQISQLGNRHWICADASEIEITYPVELCGCAVLNFRRWYLIRAKRMYWNPIMDATSQQKICRRNYFQPLFPWKTLDPGRCDKLIFPTISFWSQLFTFLLATMIFFSPNFVTSSVHQPRISPCGLRASNWNRLGEKKKDRE